jgi:hypothetical protein
MKTELQRLPDYVCTQNIERFTRATAEKAWEKEDTLRFEVALVGNQELYAAPGARQFQNRPLAEMVRRGTISTGQLGLLAKHVFVMSTAHFTYGGDNERAGKPAHQYDYDVPAEKSGYHLRVGNAESIVGFQGSFWIDPQTLDLIRLEVQAYDIPERLGLAEANTALVYSRATIDESEILLPLSATHSIAAVDGVESLNRIQLGTCHHYRTESAVHFDHEPAAAPTDEDFARNRTVDALRDVLPHGALLEVTLDANLDPSAANVGDPLTARILRPIKDGERTLVPEGAIITGHLVRVEKQNMPFPLYEVGIQFDSVELEGQQLPIVATMEEAGPAAGLLRQAKHLDPTFTRQRAARLDILVREVQHGQGFLQWDARRGSIRRGLRMKWRVEKERTASAGRD